MTPSRILLRHVWQTVFRSRAVWGLFGVLGLASVYAGWSGLLAVRQQNATRAHYQQEARRDWLSNPDKHPHRMAHYGHFAFRPKTPLSLFDFGMDSFLGTAVYLEAHKQNAVNFSEAGFSTGLLRFGEISVATVLQVLFPLLIVFLGFGLIATDRESATLRLLLSQGVSWRHLLVGNSLGLLAVVATLFGPVMLWGATLWLFVQNGAPSLDDWTRLGLLVLFYGLYLTFFCFVTVLVSAWSRTAKTALTSLIGLWLLLTLVLPRAAQAVGTYLYATPSKTAFQAAIQADIVKEGDSHNPDDPHYKALKDSLLRAYGVPATEKLPFNYSGYVMKEGEKISAALYNRHYDRLLHRFEQQNQFARLVALVDPYVALKNLSMALSGTDFDTYVEFGRQAEAYRYGLAQAMNDLQIRLISNRKLGPTERSYRIDRTYWQRVPEFVYRPAPVMAALASEGISLLALIFWGILLMILLRWSAQKLTAV